MPLFPPTPVVASLISTSVTMKTESLKSSRNVGASWVWLFKTAEIEFR